MSKYLLSFVVLAVVLVGGYLFFTNNTTPNSNSLPDVTLTTLDGGEVTIDEFVGSSVLVVNSWASWCPFCVHELPDLVELQKEFGDQITVIGVNRRESPQETQQYLSELGIEEDLVYLYDIRDVWYKAIGGFSMPETLFVNSSGETVIHKRGFMDLNEMRDHVNVALGKK
jgi:thiol-disulfide isomerase/thioredoxin